MGIREHRGAIEAILFTSGEPVSAARIAEVLELDLKTVKNLLDQIIDDYENRAGGILVLKLGDSYQMSSNKEYADKVRAALDIRRNQPLSQAALEVLAIIAYNQPVTRAFMEQIRGVDCSGVVATLCEKELIEEAGRLDLPGRPIAFKTTANFMRAFGLSSLDMLPALPQEASAHQLSEALAYPAQQAGLLLESAEKSDEQ
ncbi:MAG: SMC-Scp complex subunit ScpB [Ruminococcaceae bacterium]|nr:SMC-Scp complex subunit ScpB [Oscillospiraceae bacterium]